MILEQVYEVIQWEKNDILQYVVLEQLNSNIEKENELLSLSQGIKKKPLKLIKSKLKLKKLKLNNFWKKTQKKIFVTFR